jgi:hypothetical protein
MLLLSILQSGFFARYYRDLGAHIEGFIATAATTIVAQETEAPITGPTALWQEA